MLVAFKTKYCMQCKSLLETVFEPAAKAVANAANNTTKCGILDVDKNTIDHILLQLSPPGLAVQQLPFRYTLPLILFPRVASLGEKPKALVVPWK